MDSQSNYQNIQERLGGRNIFLIGMMGSGKSQTGPNLAKILKYAFVDMDEVIEKATDQTITNIFEQEGEEAFRDVEKKVLQGISQHHSLVIATGGGVVTLPENWGILHQGIVIWLDLDINRSVKRLKNDNNKRPLLHSSDVKKTFSHIYEKRKPLYLESDLRITVEDQTPDEVAIMIIKSLPKILIDPMVST